MEFITLTKRSDLAENQKLQDKYNHFAALLKELGTKKLPTDTKRAINAETESVNTVSHSEKELQKTIRKAQAQVLKIMLKEHKITPKNYYRNMGTAIGMSAIGVFLGVSFGLIMDNMAFLSIGLPIGMAIGLAVGTTMDKKAVKEGRQLEWKEAL